MNRRELFQKVAFAAAASGVPVTVTAQDVPSERPAFAVFSTKDHISADTARYLAESWDRFIEGTPMEGVKALVLSNGLTLTLIARDGRVLNPAIDVSTAETKE